MSWCFSDLCTSLSPCCCCSVCQTLCFNQVQTNDLVASVKARIEPTVGIPVAHQHLAYKHTDSSHAEKQMEDSCRVQDFMPLQVTPTRHRCLSAAATLDCPLCPCLLSLCLPMVISLCWVHPRFPLVSPLHRRGHCKHDHVHQSAPARYSILSF